MDYEESRIMALLWQLEAQINSQNQSNFRIEISRDNLAEDEDNQVTCQLEISSNRMLDGETLVSIIERTKDELHKHNFILSRLRLNSFSEKNLNIYTFLVQPNDKVERAGKQVKEISTPLLKRNLYTLLLADLSPRYERTRLDLLLRLEIANSDFKYTKAGEKNKIDYPTYRNRLVNIDRDMRKLADEVGVELE